MTAFAKRFHALFTAATLLASGLAAQQSENPGRQPMDLELWPTASGVQVGFDHKAGLLAIAASTNPATATIRADLPPVLMDIQVLEFRLLDDSTRVDLNSWLKPYYAQFAVLDFETLAIGISYVLTVPAAVVDSDIAK